MRAFPHCFLISGCGCSSHPEGSSLLGVSHISVNASMTINDTALTNGTISRLEGPDPVDKLDLTVCPADDLLDGCKVSRRIVLFVWNFPSLLWCHCELLIYNLEVICSESYFLC